MSKIEFLVNNTPIHSQDFAGLDSPERYETNLKTMPLNWHYRTKQISYNLNKLSYRTTEFEDIDWSNAIVLFGCSHVFGIGLAEDETLSYHLEKHFQCPVVNMGVGGSSILYSLYNQAILHDLAMPKAVVNMWTNTNRLTLLTDDQPINLYALSTLSQESEMFDSMFMLWNMHPTNPLMFSRLLQKFAGVMWNNIPHVEASFFSTTGEELNCEVFDYIDFARDLMHPGPESVKIAAEKLAKKLETL